ncbi:MAG: HAMP domain-containing sensor histidine kinase [Pirellulales bacterium]
MKRPWQIWTVFGVALAVALGIMAWLTHKAIALDRAEAAARAELDLARRQAELDDRISQALWRMDTALAPLIAQEAVRPAYVYEPILSFASGKKGVKGDVGPALSPILEQPSPFVLLHFQVDPRGAVTSPQSPVGVACEVAVQNGGSADNIRLSAERLATLRDTIDPEMLIAACPRAPLPVDNTAQSQWSLNPNVPAGGNSTYFINRDAQQVTQSPRRSFDGPPPPQQPPLDSRLNPVPDGTAQQQGTQTDVGQQSATPPSQRAAINSQANDLASRGRSVQNYAQQVEAQQRMQSDYAPTGDAAVAGVSRPVWVGDQLVLARRVTRGKDVLIQGVWLDWPKLKDWLTRSAADLLPEMSLVAAGRQSDVASQRLLATLPVELVVPPLELASASIAPLGLPLMAAWLSLALAAVAVAALLFGVVRLSERRAAFVSAVTHELRTPLTTFRLYTDMLSQGLVTDETRRGEYLDTLHAEADRLGHLVENVLSFARLERRGKSQRRETATIGRLLDAAVERLSSRAAQADLTIEVDADQATRDAAVVVDPAAVEQILFNLVDNACKYAAASSDRRLHLDARTDGNLASIRLRDHGPGVPANLAREVFRPFSRPADSAHPNVPGVGLGLALSRRLARSMKGELELLRGDAGAEFELRLPLNSR